jgi:hypothetical protein
MKTRKVAPVKKGIILTLLTVLIIHLAVFAQNKKVAIILQENTGTTILNDILQSPTKEAATRVIDALAEGFESVKTHMQAAEKYSKIIDLSDINCTRAKLLTNLVNESAAGNTIDLFIYGHGGTNSLVLHDNARLTGQIRSKLGVVTSEGNIRTLLSEARTQKGSRFNFKLRLVYMCNCFASSCNDDWVAIGAKASIGATFLNCMPEPMITFFINDFVVNNLPANTAALNAWNASKPFYVAVPGYLDVDATKGNLNKIDQSKPVVSGPETGIRHTNTRLSVNETRTFSVKAGTTHNFPTVFIRKGEKYSFTGTGTWANCNGCLTGSTSSGPAGYTPSLLDAGRRQGSYNMMTLVGELYSQNNNGLSYTGIHFKVGTSATYAATSDGFLGFFANDIITGYGDNTGIVTLTIKRTL